MKLRFYRNSLRLRLSPGDVEKLIKSGTIRETTQFTPDVQLIYTLALSTTAKMPRAMLAGHQIEVHLPREQAEEWASTETVGIQHKQTAGGKTLDILIEKDFECLETSTGDSDEKFYPNPSKACL